MTFWGRCVQEDAARQEGNRHHHNHRECGCGWGHGYSCGSDHRTSAYQSSGIPQLSSKTCISSRSAPHHASHSLQDLRRKPLPCTSRSAGPPQLVPASAQCAGTHPSGRAPQRGARHGCGLHRDGPRRAQGAGRARIRASLVARDVRSLSRNFGSTRREAGEGGACRHDRPATASGVPTPWGRSRTRV